MIGENIKKLRISNKMSQEEMAVQLHVVRQTISKYECGLSVPDAEMIIKIAELFKVPVSQILGVQIHDTQVEDLSKELERLNDELAHKCQKEKLYMQIRKVRGLILFLSFLSLIFVLVNKNQLLSIIVMGVSILSSIVILYRHLTLLTMETTNHIKLRTLKIVTIINILIFILCIMFVVLSELECINLVESSEKYHAVTLISTIIIYSGIVATRLPFSKHTGLRLPWTVQDEDTWNVAHKILSIISIPIALFYLVSTKIFPNFETVTLVIMISWICIPSLISLIFYYKKFYGYNN